MTPANPDALADALARTMWEQSFGTLANASWEEAHRIAKAIPDGQAAWNIETVRRKACEIVTLHVAPILAAKEAAEARAAQLQAEVEALMEDRADAERTVEQWFDTKAKSVEQIGPKLAEALGGYLRVCRCGGMSAEESELVEATLGDFLHRQAGSVIAPVVESMVAARTALAARAATAREG